MRKYMLISLVSLLAVACEGDIMIDEEQKLVVEGYIEDGQFPVIMVSKTIPVSKEYQPIDELDQYIVKWAKVCIIHDNDTTILTGMPNRQYYPPYIYTTGNLRAKAGERYRMTVDYKTFHTESEVTPLPTMELDSIWAEPTEGNDSLFTIRAAFHDCDPSTENHYIFYVCNPEYTEMFVPAYMGVFSDSQFHNNDRTVSIMRGLTSSSRKHQPYFLSGEHVVIKFSSIPEESFHFWQKYQNLLSFSRNIFLPSFDDLPTNITGGIGFLHGQSAKFYELDIP